jgi:hypothetical protein
VLRHSRITSPATRLDGAGDENLADVHTRLRPALREGAFVLFAMAVYAGVRAVTEGRIDRALANAASLERLEHTLGIAWEAKLQSLIVAHDTLVTVANWIYIYGHWPVIVVSATALYLHRREKYLLLRNAIIISGLMGFVFFALLPVAPPRLSGIGLVDTVTQYSHGYRALQPPSLTNQYAAMPSLHVGWNLLVAIVLFQATRRRAVRAFAVVMPLAMAFAAIGTANHFVIDAVVGSLVALVALALSFRLQSRTLDAGGSQARSYAPAAAPPVRHRTPLRQLASRPADGGGARRAPDRGGRAPLSRPHRGAPSQDTRARAGAVGPVEARQPVPSAPRPRRTA